MPDTTSPARRRVSLIGVLTSLVFLVVASIGLTGDPWWLLGAASKWIIAGVIAVIGVGLLATARPARRRRN